MSPDAVLLAGFGGPEGPDDVMPFLRNVTRGRGIPDERLVEVSRHYQALGGVSPINTQNRALRTALQEELTRRGIGLTVYWGNRNWAPYLADVVVQAQSEGATDLLAVTTSAYSSYSSCRQYREDFGGALQSTGLAGQVRIAKVRQYFDTSGFLVPFAEGLSAALQSAAETGLRVADLEIIFTTHSIPTAMSTTSGSAALGDHQANNPAGGTYVAQHLAACRAVMSHVSWEFGPLPSWQLAYQSRSGPPSMPWLEPDVNDVLGELAVAGRRGVIVVPIGFVSDHVEVVWDLDNEAADTAAGHGMWFTRVPTPGTHPAFVGMLADLVAAKLGLGEDPAAVSDSPARPDVCAAACCVNLRAVKPTTAGVDSADDVLAWSTATGVAAEAGAR